MVVVITYLLRHIVNDGWWIKVPSLRVGESSVETGPVGWDGRPEIDVWTSQSVRSEVTLAFLCACVYLCV